MGDATPSDAPEGMPPRRAPLVRASRKRKVQRVVEITEYKCTICGEWREAARPTMTFGPACRSAMSRYGWEDARRREHRRGRSSDREASPHRPHDRCGPHHLRGGSRVGARALQDGDLQDGDG